MKKQPKAQTIPTHLPLVWSEDNNGATHWADTLRCTMMLTPLIRNQCHENAARLVRFWCDGTTPAHADMTLYTGKALDSHGIWRDHSWAMDGNGCVHETTVPFMAYRGHALSGTALVQFLADNINAGNDYAYPAELVECEDDQEACDEKAA